MDCICLLARRAAHDFFTRICQMMTVARFAARSRVAQFSPNYCNTETNHENLAFHTGNSRCADCDRHPRGGAKLSLVRGLCRLWQPELWIHNHSTVHGYLE